MEKIVLVTGSTDGIGKATALELARRGWRVILHGRSPEKIAQAKREILDAAPEARLDSAAADLSSLAQARALAADVNARFERLDALIHNAGVFMKERRLSADGYEMTLAVNHLAPFLLTRELLPRLKHSRARVVTVSSIAHNRGRMNWDDLQLERGFDGYRAYAQSKLANLLFANELARRESESLTSNSLHPGVITTKLLKTGFNSSGANVEQGAATSVYLADSPEAAGVSGKYFADSRETPPAAHALDRDAQIRFWEISERMIGA